MNNVKAILNMEYCLLEFIYVIANIAFQYACLNMEYNNTNYWHWLNNLN